MFSWIQKIMQGAKASGQPATSESGPAPVAPQALRDGYLALIGAALASIQPRIRRDFDALDVSRLPPDACRLHVEIFTDNPALTARLFAYTASWVEALSPEKRAAYAVSFDPHFDENDPIDRLNKAFEDCFPLATDAELDRYTVWEEAPDGQPLVALDQPIDSADIRPLLRAFFGAATETLRQRYDGQITVGLHDIEANILDHK